MSSARPLNTQLRRRVRAIGEPADWPHVIAALLLRGTAFALWQAVIAAIFMLQGDPTPWDSSIAWWPVSVTLGNVTTLIVMHGFQRQDGRQLTDLYRVGAHHPPTEIIITVGLMTIGLPLALIPNVALGTLLYGDTAIIGTLFFRPLPLWALVPCLILLPLTISLSELPTYFAYAMPRIERLTERKWLAIGLPALFLAAQHMAFPLIFDPRFLVWRLGMFLPFALFTGYCLYRRPSLLPYFMVMHGLMDVQLVLSVLAVSPV